MDLIDTDNSIRKSRSDATQSDVVTLPAPLAEFVRTVQQDDFDHALHLLLDEALQRHLPHGKECQSWMVRFLGTESARKIVEYLIHYPCFYCRTGRILCESCNGRGGTDPDTVCEECRGFGVRACEFCGGSGWLALGAIPMGLRHVVHHQRSKIGLHRGREFIQEWENQTSSSEPTPNADFKMLAQEVLRLNRILAILENSFNVAHEGLFNGQPTPDDEGFRHHAHHVTKDLVTIQRRLVRSLLESCLAQTHRQELSDSERRRWQARADYYQARLERRRRSPSLLYAHLTLERELEESMSPRDVSPS